VLANVRRGFIVMGLKGWGSHDSSLSGSEGKDGDASQQDVYIKNMNDKGRLFSISIDVRSFKANLHLPIASANVIVRVVLPPELVRLATSSCNASATVMTPLLTHPPIQVNKGTEVIIPNGYVFFHFFFLHQQPNLKLVTNFCEVVSNCNQRRHK